MANKSISELTAGGAVADTDLFVDVQTVGQGPVKVTGSQLKTYVNNSPSLTGSVVINGTPISGVSGTGYLAATSEAYFNDPFISGASFNGAWGLNFDTYPGLVVDYPTANNARYLVYGNNGVHTFYNGTSASTPQLFQITSSGAIDPTQGIIGKTDASDATAGQVGEFISATKLGSGTDYVTCVNGSAVEVTSITLTAGDWDVTGGVIFYSASGGASTPTWSQAAASINTSVALQNVATANGQPTGGLYATLTPNAGSYQRVSGMSVRYNVTTSTTLYLVAYITVGGGTPPTIRAWGTISARRVR